MKQRGRGTVYLTSDPQGKQDRGVYVTQYVPFCQAHRVVAAVDDNGKQVLITPIVVEEAEDWYVENAWEWLERHEAMLASFACAPQRSRRLVVVS
jgi:hypothetical protein